MKNLLLLALALMASGCAEFSKPLTKQEAAELQHRQRIEDQYVQIKKNFGCGTIDPTCFPH